MYLIVGNGNQNIIIIMKCLKVISSLLKYFKEPLQNIFSDFK